MKTHRLIIGSALFVLLAGIMSFSIKNNLNSIKFSSQNAGILIKGTSTLHDWEMTSDKGYADVVMDIGNSDNITSVTALKFTIEAQSLKSGKNMMDNNAYKSLKTSQFNTLSFVLTSASVSQVNATTFLIKTSGKLTIAGTTRETDLTATAKLNADKSYTVTGTKNIDMTNYGVKPPTFMFGTITTGKDISISFNAKIVR